MPKSYHSTKSVRRTLRKSLPTGWRPHREELAWAAGFFDGEGTTIYSRRGSGYHTVIVSISQTKSEELPQRFNVATGSLGRVTGPHARPHLPTHQPQWQVNIAGFENCQAVLAMLWPWLGSVKRAQARRALDAYRARVEARVWQAWVNGRCKRGHDITLPENVHIKPDGQRNCLPCRKIAGKLRHARLRDSENAKRKAHYWANRDAILPKRREQRAARREELREWWRQYRAKNGEKLNAADRERYARKRAAKQALPVAHDS